MSYYNIKNPGDKEGGEWVQIDTTEAEVKDINHVAAAKEPVMDGDPTDTLQEFWQKVIASGRSVDAGKLQTLLQDNGFEICHDAECHAPNGITSGTAGILIAFEKELTPEQEQKLHDLLTQTPIEDLLTTPEESKVKNLEEAPHGGNDVI